MCLTSQLARLRQLLYPEDGHDSSHAHSSQAGSASNSPSHMVDNWRPLQPLNGRVVRQSFPKAPPSAGYLPGKDGGERRGGGGLKEQKVTTGLNVKYTYGVDYLVRTEQLSFYFFRK